jgi:hypothetical protein
MSAWFRYKYPHLTVGAWASSAVVNAIVDFQQYDQQVRESVSKSGQWCPDAIQNLNKQAEVLVNNKATSNEFKSLFNATTLTNQEFLFYFTDMIASLVQYGQRIKLCDGLYN